MKILTMVLVGLVAGSLHAQTVSSSRVTDWERNRHNVLAYLDAMPDSALEFRPTPGVRTLAGQFDHIISTNLDVAAAVRGLAHGPVLGDSAKFLHDKAALKAYATAVYDYVLETVRSPAAADTTRKFPVYGQPPEAAGRWLELSLEHSVWTLGQVVPYLRLSHATPPAYDMPF